MEVRILQVDLRLRAVPLSQLSPSREGKKKSARKINRRRRANTGSDRCSRGAELIFWPIFFRSSDGLNYERGTARSLSRSLVLKDRLFVSVAKMVRSRVNFVWLLP